MTQNYPKNRSMGDKNRHIQKITQQIMKMVSHLAIIEMNQMAIQNTKQYKKNVICIYP